MAPSAEIVGRWSQCGRLPLSFFLTTAIAVMANVSYLVTVYTCALTRFISCFCSYNYVGLSQHADEETEAGSGWDKGLGSEWEVQAPALALSPHLPPTMCQELSLMPTL